jgi:glycosyltransferase involved in cell wall biosynthesis
MAEVAAGHPNARYVILGATHPDLLRTEGEAYRHRLTARVAELGLTEHVIFVDQFVGRRDLARWLEAADIFVTPYPNLEQIVSGTLSYAMSAGKPIVSTPYAYATEMLGGGRGLLVERATAPDLARAFLELLGDPERRAAIGARAYDHSRRMIWPEVGSAYRRLFTRVVARPSMVDIRQPGFALADA